MEPELAPDSLGFVLFDSQWRLISANAEAIAAFKPAQTVHSDPEDPLREFAAEVAVRMQTRNPAKTFSYSGCMCTAMTFTCAYGNSPEWTNAVLIRRPGDPSSVIGSFGQAFRLTPRERETLALCLDGRDTKEIATSLGINVSTAKSLIRMIRVKMGVTTRAQVLSKVLDSMCAASLTCPFRLRRR